MKKFNKVLEDGGLAQPFTLQIDAKMALDENNFEKIKVEYQVKAVDEKHALELAQPILEKFHSARVQNIIKS